MEKTLCEFKPLTELPAGLLERLARPGLFLALRYTRPRFVYYIVGLWGPNNWCGVFGDGDNASYEWFLWTDGKRLETSDCGYGSPHSALRDVLNKAEEI